MKKPRLHWWHLNVSLGLIVIVVVAFAVGVFSGAKAHKWATVTVGGPHGTPVQTITVPAAAVDQAKASDVGDHAGLRDQTPEGAPHSAIVAAQNQDEALAATDQLPIVSPLAAPEQRGCLTRLVQDYSSRQGVRPRIFVLHYTVSPNRAGWSDVNAIVSLFDTPAFQASSNYVLDGEAHCAYIVRESDKAWTQAALNPVSISVEVINTGSESVYLAPVGLRKLAMIVSDALKRWEIPLQLGQVVNGRVTRAGIIDHGGLGPAGGGHHDIAPFPVGQVIAAVKQFRATEPDKPTPAQLKARAAAKRHAAALIKRAALRRRIVAMRAQGLTWEQIKRKPLYRQYRNLGGH